jgi:hypothetical protein
MNGKRTRPPIMPSFYAPEQRTRKKNLKIEIRKTVILPNVLCGYKTWSVILREEQ